MLKWLLYSQEDQIQIAMHLQRYVHGITAQAMCTKIQVNMEKCFSMATVIGESQRLLSTATTDHQLGRMAPS